MNKICFSIIVVLLNFTTYSQNKECSNFKIGIFKYTNPSFSKYKVTRDENIQIETDSLTGFEVKGIVKWISDCEYELVYSEVSNSKYQSIIGKKIKTFITSIEGNKIMCKSEGMGRKLDIEMIKIN